MRALPSVAAALALERVKPGVRVVGKRAGWSENIGRAVQGVR